MTTADEICGLYSLSHCDGKVAQKNVNLTIHRNGEALTAHVTAATDLRGAVVYKDRHIVGSFSLTDENASLAEESLEKTLCEGFGDGFDVTIEGDKVLLKNMQTNFVFLRSSKLSDMNGEHAIIAINDQPPIHEMVMSFIPDGNGGSFFIVNITNSLRGNCQIEAGLLRGEVATSHTEAENSLVDVERLIAEGFQEGFHIRTNEPGILLQSSKVSIQLCRILRPCDLEGEYVLKSFNDQIISSRNQAVVVFKSNEGNEIDIGITVANRIRGTATLNQNVLSSEEPLMSTCMEGTEEESHLESAFNVGFQYGLEAISYGNEITLKNQDGKFVLLRAAAVDAKNGEPTYKGTYSSKCFKAEGNGLLFRIVNEHEKRWAFYNDTTDYRMHVRATFGARSKIETLEKASMSQDDEGRYVVEVTVEPQTTEMFIQGEVNGFKLQYGAQPV
ncbi:hypothetical protein JKF63_05477 [Porcisia hertigi]|uniref:META domain containing protein n=1 Tax=Porcisia hertigi TaxID=2761500 RepID=A0A836LDI5_9TRYP|nr:hypothetical protein JKF63_05477 [Porcisia hertigi]